MMQYDLSRFIEAQKIDYPIALKEIKAGYKQSHWMWYIFPQIAGLGQSMMSKKYSIVNREEAIAYMQEPVLKNNLVEISEVLLEQPDKDADRIFGFPDNLKLQSCMTLFAEAAPEYDVFEKVLDAYFGGKKDKKTLAIIRENG